MSIRNQTLRLLLLLFISLQVAFSYSQEKKTVDSLNNFIIDKPDNFEKAKALVYLTEILSLDTIFPLCQKALVILKKIETNNPNQNREFYQTKALAFNNLGVYFHVNSNSSKAIQNFIESVKIREKIKDSQGLTESYLNIGVTYKNQSDTNNAFKYFRKSLKLAEDDNNLQAVSIALFNMGSVYSNRDYKKALTSYFKSLEFDQRLNNQRHIAKNQQNIAVIYQNIGDSKNAYNWYLKSLETKELIGDEEGLSSTYNALAKLMFASNKLKEAENYATIAYNLAVELESNIQIIHATEILYKINLRNKNYKKALEMLTELTEAKENELINNNQTETVKLQLTYENNKRRAADSLQVKLEKENLNFKINSEKEKQIWLYVFITVAIIFSLIMSNRFQKTKKQKAIIEKQKSLVDQKNKEITDSINYARRIQTTLLANEKLLKANLKDYFIINKPKDIVSGDFYWAIEKKDYFYIAVCDSTGHGVPGAFMSLLNINFLNEAINEKQLVLPNKILDYVRLRLIENVSQDGGQDGMDGVLICINKVSGEISYSASYNAPIVVSNGVLATYPANRMSIGKSPKEHEAFTLQTMQLEKGSYIYLYTDGYVDQFGGEKGKKFKLKALHNLLENNYTSTLQNQAKIIHTTFNEWKGDFDQIDDMLLIGIQI